MKKAFIIFLRVTFVLLALCVISFFSLQYYFQFESKQAIEKSLDVSESPVVGDRNSPFTIVEFFDYRCSHCPTMAKIVQEAVGNDPQTRIILRPAVMNDEESYKIASLVLAADKQKKGATLALHTEIMNLSTVPNYETVKAMAEVQGINIMQAERDGELFRPLIVQNTRLVADIGFYAVPALVIGDKGFVPTDRMPGINELRLMILDAKTRLKIK